MPNTSIATGTFASRSEANQAVQRLVSAGFARNSIELHRHNGDEGYDLEMHTRQENLKRAERLIHASVPLYAVRQTASGVVQTAKSYPFVLLGAGILAGFLIYSLVPKETASAGHSNPRNRRRR
ncbi:hypothetical protein VB618_18355 [Microvirga sp. CF3062]|uniref:hypothetical protein n=1 Tax=Microvirga sp. CF3062 TaxID=3110182 RepID=UPI002E79F30D|nr:hypothetical protein [Microvirga sp. CF3062]MEE1658164.1 hypothetical protein [Microvirga sp. CF3062]